MTRRDFAQLAGVGLAAGNARRAAGSERPNILVILADDLGYADLGFNGCVEWDTPNVDALAASGVRFTQGYATHPYCSPSRAAILTGRYQQRFGHEANPAFSPDDETIGTPTGEVMLSDVLRGAGYRTCAIGKWHLGDAPKFLPPHRGFDEWFGFSGGQYNYYGTANPRHPRDRIYRNGVPVPPSEISYLTDDFTGEAVSFIRRNARRPFFLYLAYNAVHAPDQAPQRYLDRTQYVENGLRSVYGAMAVAMDDGIGRVMRALTEAGVRDNTLIFFLSDNGGRIDAADNRPLRGHKGMMYEGGIRVPFLVSWPRRLAAGRTDARPISALDIFRTSATAAGADTSRCKPLDGVDLLPFLTSDRQSPPHEALYWRTIGGKEWAVRVGRYKAVKRLFSGEVQLYDVESDLQERHNIAAQKPQVVAELQQLHERWNSRMIPPKWTDAHENNLRKENQEVVDKRARALPTRR